MYPNTCSTLTRSFEFFLLMVSCHLLIFLPRVFRLITLSFNPELPHHPLHPFADVGTVSEQILTPVFSVLFACVVLARRLHETPVNHGALMQDQVVLLQAVCMLVWSDSFSILISGKYTNNSLNDNGLREIFTIKSSSVAS